MTVHKVAKPMKRFLWRSVCCNSCSSPTYQQGAHDFHLKLGVGVLPQFALVAQTVKSLPAIWETWVQSLRWEDALVKGTATHSSILAWRIPWTEEPSGKAKSLIFAFLQSQILRTSLVVPWLRLQASNTGGAGWIPGGELRSHMPPGAAKNKSNHKNKYSNTSDLCGKCSQLSVESSDPGKGKKTSRVTLIISF